MAPSSQRPCHAVRRRQRGCHAFKAQLRDHRSPLQHIARFIEAMNRGDLEAMPVLDEPGTTLISAAGVLVSDVAYVARPEPV